MTKMSLEDQLPAGVRQRLKEELQLPAYTLAMLRVLLDKGVIDHADVKKIYELTEQGVETLFAFFSSCIETTELEESNPEDEARAQALALKIVKTACWLLGQPINPAMREQLLTAIKESEIMCELLPDAETKTKGR